MRHHLVVHLQPIGMICEVMDRRLRAPAPDLARVQDSVDKIGGFTKAALESCVDVVGWLAPDDVAACTVAEAARESTALLATAFSFRGYALYNETAAMPGLVRRSGIRHLLAATLLHCTDDRPAPADLVLAGAAQEAGALLSVTVRRTQDVPCLRGEANDRPITWDDLQALAQADGAAVAREGERILLRFSWVRPAAGQARQKG